jgi:hypothetical protein
LTHLKGGDDIDQGFVVKPSDDSDGSESDDLANSSVAGVSNDE